MGQTSRTILKFTLVLLMTCVPVFAQRRTGGVRAAYASGGPGNDYRPAGSYNGGGFYPSYNSPSDVPSNYWWVGPYPSENPCQAGCNPNAGYEWDSVGTLILETNPPKARVTLDGIYAGTTDKLGPFQLPVGQYTLHIEAVGFEPCDITVRFDQPGVQSLNVELKRVMLPAKPAPHP